MEKRLLSARDLSEYLGVRPRTIYNKINNGTFPIPYKRVFKLLRWERTEVDSYLNKLAVHHGLKK